MRETQHPLITAILMRTQRNAKLRRFVNELVPEEESDEHPQNSLCDDDPRRVEQAIVAAHNAVEARLGLWDAVLEANGKRMAT